MSIAAPRETEIKLAATRPMLEGLREHPALAGTDHADALLTTYFDTPDRRLARSGASLRLRESAQGREQTVKLPARTDTIVVRGEWTSPAAGDAPDIDAFPDEPRLALAGMLDGAVPLRIAETCVARTTRRIAHGSAEIEIALDLGEIRAGTRQAPICELELELLLGELADLIDLALALPLGPDLQWSVASKSGRALALADGTTQGSAHATPAGISRDVTVAEGFRAIAWSCLSHLLENTAVVVATGDPAALHQCRVAMRRMRASWKVFAPLFANDPQADVLDAELKAAANATGPARDTQVLLDRLLAEQAKGNADVAELVAHIRPVLDEATAATRELLAGHEFQALLFRLALWIERGDWLGRADDSDALLPRFAAHALRKRRRAVRRLTADPAQMTPEERHKLRIAVKKLRYAADFLAPLYRSKPAQKAQRRFKSAAAKAQDCLGTLHDLDVLATGREALFAECEPIAAARLSAQLTELTPSLAKSHHKLLKRAGKAVARLDACEPWWKADL